MLTEDNSVDSPLPDSDVNHFSIGSKNFLSYDVFDRDESYS